ncbi:MAG TPA: ScyD/ScyE family protein [Thermomicrobiales bacterium]|nr:ScyD/ScyE family protein [Thermomicrobiales bacterium]
MFAQVDFGKHARHAAAVIGGAMLLASPLAVAAQDATPGAPPPGPPPFVVPAGCTSVAKDLINPRGLFVTADGTLYIAEAGNGGEVGDFGTPVVGTPSPDPVTSHGDTGRISMVAADGTQSVVADGLTSYVFGSEVVGPAGVAVAADGTIYAAIGGPGPNTAAFPPAGLADHVVSIDAKTGAATSVADIGSYERENNPDPNAVDSNLSAIAIAADGSLYVADAGGNVVYKVDPATGTIAVLAVIPGLPSANGEANPERGGKAEIDPVPTSLVADPSGGVYVGLLTGAGLWGVPGSAKILHIAEDGTITDTATGLHMTVGIAMAADGTWYATTFSANLFAEMPEPGYVSKIGADGTPEQVVPGLFLAYGLAFGPDGSLYVAAFASTPPGTPGMGQVLKCAMGM